MHSKPTHSKNRISIRFSCSHGLFYEFLERNLEPAFPFPFFLACSKKENLSWSLFQKTLFLSPNLKNLGAEYQIFQNLGLARLARNKQRFINQNEILGARRCFNKSKQDSHLNVRFCFGSSVITKISLQSETTFLS